MVRFLFAAICVLLSGSVAQAQQPIFSGIGSPALVGTAISQIGYNPSVSGALFVAAAASLQTGTQVTVSYDIKSTSLRTSTTSTLVDSRPPGSNATGFATFLSFNENADFFYMFAANPAGFNSNSSFCRNNAGHICWREAPLNDGAWHSVCHVFNSPTNTFMTYDGVVRDLNGGQDAVNPALGFTPSTSYWQIGNAGVNNFAIRELQVWPTALQPSDCFRLSLYHHSNLRPTSGSLAAGTSIWIPFQPETSNCTVTGCLDISGNANNAAYDSTPPTVAITAPASGQLGITGSFNVTGTCTDPIGITSVSVFVDNILQGTATSSPFSVAWVTTNYIDGSHAVTAKCFNAGATIGSATLNASTSNGVNAKIVYIDPVGGNDSTCVAGAFPINPTYSLACQTLAKANSFSYHGGDNILIKAGSTINLANLTDATVLLLNGPLSTKGSQNVIPGQTLLVSTYGGSGNCHVLAGVTTDCASIVFNANGTTTQWDAIINVVNVPNVNISNLQLFGQQTHAQTCPDGGVGSNQCSIGVRFSVAGGYNNGFLNTSTLSNTTIMGFYTRVYVSGVTDPQFSSFGNNCGTTITDNYMDDSSSASITGTGVEIQVADCTPLTSNGLTATVSANYINNVGGQSTNGDGSGIVWLGTMHNLVDTNNVTTNGGLNVPSFGPYGNWWDVTATSNPAVFNIVEGNESALYIGSVPAGDHGAFDLDNATNGFNFFWNYAHETFGPSVNMLTGSSNGLNAGNNTQAYNILEDGTAGTTNQNAGLITIGAAVGASHLFNNSIWNGYNGQTISPNTQATLVAGIDLIQCPPVQSVFANNIVVSNSVAFVASAEFYYGGFNINCPTKLDVKKNDWFPIGTGSANLLWRSVNAFATSYTTLATWNTAVSGTDITQNPNFAGSGGGATQCYTALSGIPVQPGSIPCPSAYQLNNSGNVLIGAGFNYASLVPTAPGDDFFTNTVPNGGVGTGYNIGADGGHH